MIVIIVIFFIVFVIQIRKISGDIEYIDERRRHIGLADRIDYYK
jgi:hypothetical protein